MKFRLCMLSAVLMVALLTGMAWGYPTRFGPATGLVDVPTADVAMPGSAELAVDYFELEDGTKVWPARLLVGVSSGAELGITYTKLKDGVSDEFASIGAKLALMQPPLAGFDLAIGTSFLNNTGSDILDLYVVATKEFPVAPDGMYRVERPYPPVRGHVGIMYTRVSNSTDDDEIKPFLGLDITTPEGASFVAEYKWTKFGSDEAAAAIRYPVSPAVSAQLGVARTSKVHGQNDYRLLIGVNYNFVASGETGEGYD